MSSQGRRSSKQRFCSDSGGDGDRTTYIQARDAQVPDDQVPDARVPWCTKRQPCFKRFTRVFLTIMPTVFCMLFSGSWLYFSYKNLIQHQSISGLYSGPQSWPGSRHDGAMYNSEPLFQAVLENARNVVKGGEYFWKQLQFYTDAIDAVYGWLCRSFDGHFDTSAVDTSTYNVYPWPLIRAYQHLMSSVNLLGAEQALCTVYQSMVCFSHRETFRYANYSFAGEFAFRAYRQSFPRTINSQYNNTSDGWTVREHRRFFPVLSSCRDRIFADLDYLRSSTASSSLGNEATRCDYSRKNETRIDEVRLLTVVEQNRLTVALEAWLDLVRLRSEWRLLIAAVLFTCFTCYALAVCAFKVVLISRRLSGADSDRKRKKLWKAADILDFPSGSSQNSRHRHSGCSAEKLTPDPVMTSSVVAGCPANGHSSTLRSSMKKYPPQTCGRNAEKLNLTFRSNESTFRSSESAFRSSESACESTPAAPPACAQTRANTLPRERVIKVATV